MASIRIRVTGTKDGQQATSRFRDTAEGREQAAAFETALEDPRRVFDVRVRIGGRDVCKSFTKISDAKTYAKAREGEKVKGEAVDPRRAKRKFGDFAEEWLSQRADLAERTVELYRWLLDKHILPTFGDANIGSVLPSTVSTWHGKLAKDHQTTAAKAYRLLRTILNAAVGDEIITRNPCVKKGAGVERAPERPTATLAEVEAVVSAMPERMRLAVLLALWTQLRIGEVLGLRRRDVNLLHQQVIVANTRTTKMDGTVVEKGPKTPAGQRVSGVPENVLPALERHLDTFVAPTPDAYLFTCERSGHPLSYRSLQVAWGKAREVAGRPDLRFHDLRHTGATLYAAAGASTREVMRRLGHSSPASALRYQHATDDRDRVLTEALAVMARGAQLRGSLRDTAALRLSEPATNTQEKPSSGCSSGQRRRGSTAGWKRDD
jgi:integrase